MPAKAKKEIRAATFGPLFAYLLTVDRPKTDGFRPNPDRRRTAKKC
jgi:hypothetical protein